MSQISDPGITPLKRPEPLSRQTFVDVDQLRNSHGMVAIISQRISNGLLTFSIFREFERGGEIAKTAFFPEDQADIYLEFAKLVLDRMRELRAGGNLPISVRSSHAG